MKNIYLTVSWFEFFIATADAVLLNRLPQAAFLMADAIFLRLLAKDQT